MDTKELSGLYQVWLKSRGNQILVVDRTDCEMCAKAKAAQIRGLAFDSQLNKVFSPQAGVWLKPETQQGIEGAISDNSDEALADAVFGLGLELLSRVVSK